MLISNIVVDWVNNALHAFLLLLDSVVFWFASQCYQLFIKLAGTKIFEDSFFSNFANRIYVILGIFMLFYLAYALLMAIVDPEKFAKGDKGVSKIASNLVVSLVILGFLPTIFSYAYRLQNYILSSNLIGALLIGSPVVDVNNTDGNNNQMVKYGDVLSFTVLNTFLNPENINFSISNNYTWFDFKIDVLENSNYTAMPGMNKAVSTGAVALNSNGEQGASPVITYMPVVSTAMGIFLCYILLNFLLNLGGRVAKMAFYQLLAPIPVIMRVIPGKKGNFDKYLKQSLSVFFEVFTYTGALYLAIYFINAIANSSSLSQFFGAGSGVQGKLAFLVILMGILTFAKEMPKKLSEILGIETGGFKLGIKDKLKAGGFFAGGAMLGAGVTGLTQNMMNGFKNIGAGLSSSSAKFKNSSSFFGKAKALGGGVLGLGRNILGTGASMAAGATSGAYNAYGTAKDAKGFKDMQKAASAGAKKAAENRKRRANYIASNNGLVGATLDRMNTGVSMAVEWAIGRGLSDILTQIDFKEGFNKEYDEYKNLYNNPEYQALEAQLNQYKSMKAAGETRTATGANIDDAIRSAGDALRNKRATAISKNKDAAAYIAYNLSRYAKENYGEFKASGLNFNGADINDFILRGDKIYHANGNEYSAEDLLKLFENVDSSQYTSLANGDIEIDINPATGEQFTDAGGLNAQVRNEKKALKAQKQSAAYKEAQKKKEAAKNNK